MNQMQLFRAMMGLPTAGHSIDPSMPAASPYFNEGIAEAFGDGDLDYETEQGSPEQDALVYAFGARDSGDNIVKPDGAFVRVLARTGLPQVSTRDGMTAPTMPGGVAVVHVYTQDWVDAQNPAPTAGVTQYQQRLMLRVRWQNGNAGGTAMIDATTGCVFSVGGVHSVEVDAVLLDPDSDTAGPTTRGFSQRVEACVFWKSAVQPKDCYVTTRRLTLDGTNESARVRIPDQVKSVLLMTTNMAAAANLTLRLFYNDVAAAGAAYQTVNPVANGTPIAGGVKFFSAIAVGGAGSAMTVTPIFEMNL